jgi:ACS family hexuronate transporter-like MFS transporter
MWLAVSIVSVAAAAHQWWSCNLFTTVSDMFPRKAVASVVGIGGFAGAMAGMAFQRTTGRLLDATKGDYTIIFAVCGVMYLVALLFIHLLVPRLEPASVPSNAT